METEIRIVSATVHQDSKEVEIIVEETTLGLIEDTYALKSILIDVEGYMYNARIESQNG